MSRWKLLKSETYGELRGVYAVWLREVKRYIRDRARLVSAVTGPIMWLLLFGVGVGGFLSQSGVNYVNFLFPGIVSQSLLFTSIYLGISII